MKRLRGPTPNQFLQLICCMGIVFGSWTLITYDKFQKSQPHKEAVAAYQNWVTTGEWAATRASLLSKDKQKQVLNEIIQSRKDIEWMKSVEKQAQQNRNANKFSPLLVMRFVLAKRTVEKHTEKLESFFPTRDMETDFPIAITQR